MGVVGGGWVGGPLALVPAFPVFPGGVGEGRVGIVGRILGRGDGRGSFAPACAMRVVGTAADGVREDLVGLDDESVALEAFDGCEGVPVCGTVVVVLAVGVVDLHEIVEFVFAVGCMLFDIEDFVRGGSDLRRLVMAAGPVEIVSEVWRGA